MVRWTVTESSYGGVGEGFVHVAAGADGGSRVHAEWGNSGARRQKWLLLLIRHSPMNRVLSRLWAAQLDRYAVVASREGG